MMAVDDWAPVTPAPPAKGDDWADVNKPIAIGRGEQQAGADKALVEAEGISPESEAAQAFIRPAADAALFNIPTRLVSTAKYLGSDKPWSLAELQKAQDKELALQEAIARRNPYLSGTGTAAGIGAGFFTPLGWLGKGAQVAKGAAEAAGLGARATKAAELGGAGLSAGALTGASSFIERGDLGEAAKSGAIGAGLGAGLHGALGKVLPGAVKPSSTEDLQATLDKVAGGPGRISAQNVPGYAEDAAKLGGSEAVAKQALLREAGVPEITQSMVTGRAAPTAAADISQRATDTAKDVIAKRAETLAGAAPAEGEIAQALAKKIETERPIVRQGYKDLSELGKGATFQEEANQLFLPAIMPKLTEANIPSTPKALADSGYTQASAAMKFIQNGIHSNNLPLSNTPRNVDNYEAVRQALKNFQKEAKPGSTDSVAMGAILKGFDSAYTNSLEKFLVSEKNPDIGKQMLAQLEAARAKSADFNKRFRPLYGTGSQRFKNAVNQMADTSTGQIKSDLMAGTDMAAQKVLTGGLMDPKVGEAMYVRLQNAFGKGSKEMDMVTQHIRNHVLTPEVNRDISSLPNRINKFLNDHPSMARRVFTGQNDQPSVEDIRKLAAQINIINKQPISQPEKESRIGSLVGYLVKGALVTAGAGHGIVPGALTYAATEGTQKAAGAIRSGAARRAEAAGAPKTREAPNIPTLVRNPAAYELPVGAVFGANDKEPGYREPQPLARKSGGRVSDQLVRAVDRAKKNINKGTEVLLTTPDSHVAHALEVANRNLEG